MIRVLFAALMAAFCSTAAYAQTKVGDWEIEKRSQDDHCNATRAYKDEDDGDKQNVILVSYSKERIVVVLVYEGWEWDKKDGVVKADLSTDKSTIMKKAKWEIMDKDSLRGTFEFDQAILDRLGKGKTMTLTFDDDDTADFDIPKAGEALAALKFCEENKK